MCPLPAAVCPAAPRGIVSVTQMFPCLSTWTPCGNTNIPSPKLFNSLPDASNLSTTGRFDPTQEFSPHLSATQMDFPSRSISTALVAPHFRPSGIFAQFSTVAYGLGSSLTGWMLPWVDTLTTDARSEERRVGKECRAGCRRLHLQK